MLQLSSLERVVFLATGAGAAIGVLLGSLLRHELLGFGYVLAVPVAACGAVLYGRWQRR